MPQPLEATLPAIILNDGCQVVFEARDAVTGALVSGVTVSEVAIYADNASDDGTSTGAAGPFMLVPGPDSAV